MEVDLTAIGRSLRLLSSDIELEALLRLCVSWIVGRRTFFHTCILQITNPLAHVSFSHKHRHSWIKCWRCWLNGF